MAATTEYISVLPEGIDSEQRYLRLPHPRTGAPQLYLPYDRGICEVVKVSGARGRTWFIGDDTLAEGTLLMHNPVDPFFLAVPIALSLIPDNRPAQFQPLPDLLSTAASSPQFGLKPAFSPTADVEAYNRDMGRLVELKGFRSAFRACCDKKLVGAAPPSPPPEDDASPPRQSAYFRPSRDAILTVLKAKVDNLAKIDNFNKFDHLVRSLGRDGLLETNVDEKLVHAARTRAAIEQIAQWLPIHLTAQLTQCYDMLALDAYLADRAAAARAAAAPVVQGNGKEKAAAKRKAASQTSRGVEQLKKVKTEGMAKLTSFFKPKDK